MEWPNKRPRLASVMPTEVDYQNIDLQQAQIQNDRRLKSKFENIFRKYERDFTGVGDEIDLETGEIVIDNGHVSRMRDEQDVGNAVQNTPMTGRSLLRALTVAPEPMAGRSPLVDAQINGRSLLRALTVAPEDADVPFDSIEDNGPNPSSYLEDEELEGRDWGEYAAASDHDPKNIEMGDSSSDSDDSILGPKKNRVVIRDPTIPPRLSPHPNQARPPLMAISRTSEGQRSSDAVPDPMWRVPPINAVLRSPIESKIVTMSPPTTYISPNNRSIWAPIQTRRSRKNQVEIPNPQRSGHDVIERSNSKPLSHKTKDYNDPPSISKIWNDESDDPLQENFVTTSATKSRSSPNRSQTVESEQSDDHSFADDEDDFDPRAQRKSSHETVKGEISSPLGKDNTLQEGGSIRREQLLEKSSSIPIPKEVQNRLRQDTIARLSSLASEIKPMTEHEQRVEGDRNGAMRGWYTRRIRNGEIQIEETDHSDEEESEQSLSQKKSSDAIVESNRPVLSYANNLHSGKVGKPVQDPILQDPPVSLSRKLDWTVQVVIDSSPSNSMTDRGRVSTTDKGEDLTRATAEKHSDEAAYVNRMKVDPTPRNGNQNNFPRNPISHKDYEAQSRSSMRRGDQSLASKDNRGTNHKKVTAEYVAAIRANLGIPVQSTAEGSHKKARALDEITDVLPLDPDLVESDGYHASVSRAGDPPPEANQRYSIGRDRTKRKQSSEYANLYTHSPLGPDTCSSSDETKGGKRKPQGPRKLTYLTPEDDAYLIYLKEVENLNWAEITKRFGGKYNFYKLQSRYAKQLAPGALERKEAKKQRTQSPRRGSVSNTSVDQSTEGSTAWSSVGSVSGKFRGAAAVKQDTDQRHDYPFGRGSAESIDGTAQPLSFPNPMSNDGSMISWTGVIDPSLEFAAPPPSRNFARPNGDHKYPGQLDCYSDEYSAALPGPHGHSSSTYHAPPATSPSTFSAVPEGHPTANQRVASVTHPLTGVGSWMNVNRG